MVQFSNVGFGIGGMSVNSFVLPVPFAGSMRSPIAQIAAPSITRPEPQKESGSALSAITTTTTSDSSYIFWIVGAVAAFWYLNK
jgi:hypothetical protein